MFYRLTGCALILGGMLAVAPVASADIIALWNFDDSVKPDTTVPGSELAEWGQAASVGPWMVSPLFRATELPGAGTFEASTPLHP